MRRARGGLKSGHDPLDGLLRRRPPPNYITQKLTAQIPSRRPGFNGHLVKRRDQLFQLGDDPVGRLPPTRWRHVDGVHDCGRHVRRNNARGPAASRSVLSVMDLLVPSGALPRFLRRSWPQASSVRRPSGTAGRRRNRTELGPALGRRVHDRGHGETEHDGGALDHSHRDTALAYRDDYAPIQPPVQQPLHVTNRTGEGRLSPTVPSGRYRAVHDLDPSVDVVPGPLVSGRKRGTR